MNTPLAASLRIPRCEWTQLQDGQCRGFDAHGSGRDTVLIVRSEGRLHAYEDRCPHLDTPMAWRKGAYLNASGTRIICAAHGAQFDIETGECLLGPCLGQRLTRVEIEGVSTIDGSVQLEEDPAIPHGTIMIATALTMTFCS